jgi:hypothetical protein
MPENRSRSLAEGLSDCSSHDAQRRETAIMDRRSNGHCFSVKFDGKRDRLDEPL